MQGAAAALHAEGARRWLTPRRTQLPSSPPAAAPARSVRRRAPFQSPARASHVAGVRLASARGAGVAVHAGGAGLPACARTPRPRPRPHTPRPRPRTPRPRPTAPRPDRVICLSMVQLILGDGMRKKVWDALYQDNLTKVECVEKFKSVIGRSQLYLLFTEFESSSSFQR